MMKGLQFKEDRISEKARRSFARMAAGLVLVSSLGCSSRPLIPDTPSSSYYSTPVRARDLHHHLDDPSVARVSVQGVDVRVIDLALPLESLLRRSQTRTLMDEERMITDNSGTQRNAHYVIVSQRLEVERYERRDQGTISVRGQAAFGFVRVDSTDGTVAWRQMVVTHEIGGPQFSREFAAEEFASLVERGSGQRVDGAILAHQGAFGRYTGFAILTCQGQPMGRIAQGQLAMAITYDHQRGEATGGIVVLHDP